MFCRTGTGLAAFWLGEAVSVTDNLRINELEGRCCGSMEIQNRVKSLVPKLVAKFPMIEVLYLFGSTAVKKNKPDSDLDLAVFIDCQNFKIDPVLDLEIGAFVEQSLHKETDVLIMNKASPIIQHEVIKNGIKIFEKNSENRAKYELAAFKAYVDMSYYQEKRRNKDRLHGQ